MKKLTVALLAGALSLPFVVQAAQSQEPPKQEQTKKAKRTKKKSEQKKGEEQPKTP